MTLEPITHAAPRDVTLAVKIPAAIKRLAVDEQLRSLALPRHKRYS